MASSSQPRSYTFYTKSTWRRKLVAWSMLFLYLTQPILVSAEVVADPKAPGGNTPQVQTTANGLPVVQITAPSTAGVSRNLYQQFSVDPSGLILNNSQIITQTQLAGYITGNPNLANGSARIILNEVTSNNPSYLRGYTEVAGQKAEVIIANPNGIYGDGFGFINTSRAVLTTGNPVFGGSGSLDAFRVTGGQISIQGAGMNATDVDQVDLISRSVAVNAGIWAKNLNVVAGSNQVDHNTLQTQTIAGDTNIPQVAVDVGQLGGMYAQKIYLVGTENGVGVNSKGTIAAQAGDVTITSAGKVLLAGSTSATGNIQVAAKGDVTNENTLYAQGNTSIVSQGTLENSGTLVAGQHTTLNAQSISSTGTLGAGVKSDGTLSTDGDLTLNANGTISAQGQNMAARNLTITGAALDLANSQNYAGGNANLTSTTGDIDHSNGTMQVGGELNMNAQGVIRNDNGTINAGKMTLQGDSIRNHGGTLTQLGQGATTISAVNELDNTAGTISTNGDSLIMQADSMQNSQGQIQHAGNGTLDIAATTSMSNTNGANIQTNGNVVLRAGQVDNTKGNITAIQGIELTGNVLTNNQGTLATRNGVNITLQDKLNNQKGIVEAGKALTINAQSITNNDGSILSLDASEMTVAASQDIDNTAGVIAGNGDVNLAAQSVVNNAGKIMSQGSITGNVSQSIDNTGGSISAKQNVTIGKTSTNIVNAAQGSITAGGNLIAQANTLSNTGGTMAANAGIAVNAAVISGTGTITAGQDINLTVNGDISNLADSNVKANRDVNLTAVNFTNLGNIAAVGNLNVNANNITNQTSANFQGGTALTITAAGNVINNGNMEGDTANINAQGITNTGSIFGDDITMTANTISNHDNTAVIAATKNINLYAKTSLENKDDASIYSLGNINIAGSSRQNGTGEYIDSTGAVLNQAATIEAEGNIVIYAGEINNKPKDILTETNTTVTTSSENISSLPGSYIVYPTGNWMRYNQYEYLSGTKESTKTVTETSITGIDEGKILARGNMFIKADTLTNELSQILANGRLDANVTFFNNHGGGHTITTSITGQTIYNRRVTEYILSQGWDHWENYDTEVIPNTEEISVEKSEDNTIFGGGKEVSIHAVTVNNQNINPTVLNGTAVSVASGDGVTSVVPSQKGSSEITLPTSKLYTIHPEPNQKYLVETNPRFTNYKTFISSDYMLNSLSIQPELVEKRLGDGFYEQKLIQEQIINLTGRTSLGQYESDEEEYKALMNSGVTYAKEFNLQVGVALTPEQMAQLTSDMVWLVEKEVEGQKVLVPEVYLSQVKQDELKTGGALIAADKVEINASGDLTNTGSIKASTQSDIVAGNIINIGGTIDGGKIANITAVNDIVNQSGILTGGQLTLTAGGDIKNETLTTQLNSDNYSTTFINQTAKIEAKDNLTVKAGRDIQVIGADIIAGQDANISAGRNVEVNTVQNNQSMSVAYKDATVSYDKTTNIASNITAGGKLDITAVKDISLTGTNLNSKQDMNITADKLTVTAAQDTFQVTAKEGKEGSTNIGLILQAMDVQTPGVDQVASEFKGGQSRNYSYEETKNIGSTLVSDASININTKGDTLLSGVTVDAGENFKATVEGNLTITATKDNAVEDYSKNTYKNSSHVQTADETTNASTISAKKDVTLDVKKSAADAKDGSLAIQGSYIVGDGTVNISADNGVTIEGVSERHESLTESRSVKSGFLSKKVTETSDHSVVNEVVGSTISGDTVSISSGNDLTVKGSNVVGTKDVSLTATNDVNITSAAETGADDHYSYTKKSGLFSGGGLGFTIGSQSTKITTNEQTLDQVGSTVGSIDGSVSITAHNDVNSAGTTFVTGKDLNITGKDVTIDNTVNTFDSQTKYEFKQSGLSVSLGGGIVDTATNAYNNIERSGQVEDDRLKTLYDYKAYKDLDKINDQLDNGTSKENLKQGVSVSVSLGSSQTTTEQTTHTETVNTSNIDAGGKVNITATAGDVNLIGTNINATDVTLDAKNNINIESAENKMQTDTNTSSSSWSVGGTIGSGYFANASKGSSSENENAISNTGSVINASGTLTLNSGNDTNIIGSQVSGDKVVATIDGNLNIVSKQDTDDYTAKNQSSGFGISTGSNGGETGSISQGKTDSTYASVTEQASIHAGEGGFDIHVGKNTDLKGAVISSDATPDKNKLSTDTLTWTDLHNKAKYDSSSYGMNYDSHTYKQGDPNYKNQGLTPFAGVTASGDADSTTKSAISPGTIEIRSNPNQDISNLSRDTTNSLNTLGKIFDKATVQEQQELIQMFGEVAFDAIGKLGLKEDDPKKVALKTIFGGILSQMSGGSFASGATSAAFNQIFIKELSKITDPALLQWASFIVGATVSELTGGDGLTGGSITLNDIRNNFLSHPHALYNVDYSYDGKNIKLQQVVVNGDAAIVTVDNQGVDTSDLGIVKDLFNYVCNSGNASFEGKEFVEVQLIEGNVGVTYQISTRDVQKYGLDNLEFGPAGQGESDFILVLAGTDLVLGNVALTGVNSPLTQFDLQLFAKKRDLKMVNDAAKEVGIDRDVFGEFIHEIKADLGMKPSDNFTYQQLLQYARDLKNKIGW